MNGCSRFCLLGSPFVFSFGSGSNVNTNREAPEPRSVHDTFAILDPLAPGATLT